MKKLLTCHCKKVKIEVTLPDNPVFVRCNCSLCKRKGAIMTMVNQENFKILDGKSSIKKYQFHTKVANHFFCCICGIYTHHNPRRDPKLFGVNVGCLENFDENNIKDIKNMDGKNHPMDKSGDEKI